MNNDDLHVILDVSKQLVDNLPVGLITLTDNKLIVDPEIFLEKVMFGSNAALDNWNYLMEIKPPLAPPSLGGMMLHIDFTKAKVGIKQIMTSKKKLSRLLFNGCKITNLNLSAFNIKTLSYISSDLKGMIIDQAEIKDCVLKNSLILESKISNTNIDKLNSTNNHWLNSVIDDNVIQEALIEEDRIKVNFNNTKILSGKTKRVIFSGSELNNFSGNNIFFSKTTFNNTTFNGFSFKKTQFSNCKIKGRNIIIKNENNLLEEVNFIDSDELRKFFLDKIVLKKDLNINNLKGDLNF